MPFSGDIPGLIAKIIAILVALSVHECAHAWAAHRLGDPTAHNAGRLTVNPLAHLDPVGTLVFLFTLHIGMPIGWAKPVPVNPTYFARPKRDSAIVALAGPLSNFLLALLSLVLLLVLFGRQAESFGGLLSLAPASSALILAHAILIASLFSNIGLMTFNLLPIAPLDGSKVLQLFIPWRHEDRYDDFLRIGPWVLLFLLFLAPMLGLPILEWWMEIVGGTVLRSLEFLTHTVVG